MDCIFCKIINGEIPSYTGYEDDLVKVIFDVNPVTDGHLLIIPKVHYKDFNDIPDELLIHINKVKKRLCKGLEEVLKVDGVTFTQNNGYGQTVKHYHMHVIPRYNGDNIDFIPSAKKHSVEEIFKKLS